MCYQLKDLLANSNLFSIQLKREKLTIFYPGPGVPPGNIVFHYMAELVQGEKEHSDWFPESGPNFAIRTAKMDRLRSDFTHLCS